MSAPDFDQLANLMIEEGAIAFSPSELHGAIVGQLTAAKRFDKTTLEAFCVTQLDITRIALESSSEKLMALYTQILEQLESSAFELAILLPDDEQSLVERAEHLGLWVTGFLAGFGMAIGDQGQHLSNDAQDGLKDLVQIAQIEADGQAEEDENLLMEVEEYVRMAAMLLFSECNKVESTEADKPVMH
jgi:uncharacterized protein YgfB (UPF0149 family)